MSRRTDYEDEAELSGSEENDGALDKDMEALRRACMLTGTNPNNITTTNTSSSSATTTAGDLGGGATDSESEDDLELVRNIQKRFPVSADLCKPLSMKPLCSLPPVVSDDDEDDFETLRAVQRRFASYNSGTLKDNTQDSLEKPNQFHASSVASEKGSANNSSVNKTNSCEGYPDWKDACNTAHLSHNNVEIHPASFIDWHQSDAHKLSMVPIKNSSFPKSALGFINAIKKNRSCQKFIRDKLIQIEARIEENKKLKERVKLLKDFQVSCRKRTGRALSQKKDPRVQLISVRKTWASKCSKVNDKKVSSMHYGPAENSHVANYTMALTKYPISHHKKKWSQAEKENLGKGIRQQFQELVLLISVDRFSGSEASPGDSNNIDAILASIKDLEITPEQLREFLPKVDWQQLASMYFVGRSGSECEARWLNCEDPLINHNPWTIEEDKKLLFIVEKNGLSNWVGIAVSLGTNRTPFQCLARFQRSLNARILNREWTKEEDDRLRNAVEIFGESDWQAVAFHVKGRIGTQCSNRWKKSLHPARERVGRWSLDEDKRLKVAVMLFGPKNWNKIAQFVPGRDQVQCRERWVNSLDPTLNWNEWTEEEDSRLKAAIAENGYCWSKVAACVPPRTDNQCRRRWKVLLPHEVPLLQAAQKMQKAALICNFVDREAERPALGPNDFLPLAMISSVSEPETANLSMKQGRQSRGRPESEKDKDSASCYVPKKKRATKQPPRRNTKESGEHQHSTWYSGKSMLSEITDGTEELHDNSSCLDSTFLTIVSGEKVDTSGGDDTVKQRAPKLHSKKKTMTLKQNRTHKQHCRRNKSTKPSGECQDFACSEQDVPKRSKPRNKSCSKLTSETTEGDDITLSCFLHNKSKKRKLDTAKSANQACPPSSMIKRSESPSNGVDRILDRNQVLSPMQVGEAQACYNGVNPENLSSRNMQVRHSKDIPTIVFSAKGGTVVLHESASEPLSINPEVDSEAGDITEPLGERQDFGCVPCQQDAPKKSKPGDKSYSIKQSSETTGDDITLACLLRNKSKKRKLDIARSSKQACSSSEGVDQLLNGNQMLSLLQDSEAQACCNGINNISSCNMQSSQSRDMPTIIASDKGGTIALHESVREPVSIAMELDSEAGNITLASFLHNKLKKRWPGLGKTAGKACSSPQLK